MRRPTALARASRISEAYDLAPMPTGVLAVALAWDPASSAAQAFVGISHGELLAELQSELLGTELVGLEGAASETGRGLDDDPVPSLHEAMESLSPVVAFLPAWLARLLVVAAVVGVYFSVTTTSAWQFTADDDLAPPIDRPALASAVPTTAELDEALSLEFVRTQDGLPRTRTFDSVLPFFWDERHEAIDGAWGGHWLGADGRSEAVVEVVTTRFEYEDGDGVGPTFGNECSPSETDTAEGVIGESGFEAATTTRRSTARSPGAGRRRSSLRSLSPGASAQDLPPEGAASGQPSSRTCPRRRRP